MHHLDRLTAHQQRRRRHRGVSSVLAMLYLILFGTLAIGFYASTTMTAQVSANEERADRAQLAAESGMDFMRRHLARVNIPLSASTDAILTELYLALSDRLDGTANLRGNELTFDGTTIRIPAIDLGRGSYFTAWIALADPAAAEPDMLVSVRGIASGLDPTVRDVSMTFLMSEWPATVFDFGIASRGAIQMDSNARVRGLAEPQRGSILITSLSRPALKLQGNGQVSGKVSLVNTSNTVEKSASSTINGTSNPLAGSTATSDIELSVAEPQFPYLDTSGFREYAGNPLYGGLTVSQFGQRVDGRNVKNVLIRSNTNPTFGNNSVIEGVIYIETPNRVTFESNIEFRGVIAVENDPVGTPGSNAIIFNSNTMLGGLDSLPATPEFPQELRDMAGGLILAPTFLVHIDSNFGAAGGHLVASQFYFGSNARGTIYGSLINLGETAIRINSNADLAFSEPYGLGPAIRFGGHFMPDMDTYQEGT